MNFAFENLFSEYSLLVIPKSVSRVTLWKYEDKHAYRIMGYV